MCSRRAGASCGYDRPIPRRIVEDAGVEIVKKRGGYAFAVTQHTQTMEERDPFRAATFAQYHKEPEFARPVPDDHSMFPLWNYNQHKWGMSIDLNAYKPRLSFRTGGLSGPAIRPLAVHLAHQAARAVRIPVIGIGGVSSAEDALEFLVAGCAAVQVGTATFVDGSAISSVHDGIAAYLDREGFASLEDLPRYLPRD